MAFKHITSRDNPVFKQLRKLLDQSRERKKTASTLLEGVHLIEAYYQTYGEPRLLIIPEGHSTVEATGLIQQLSDVDTMLLPTLMFAELAPVASSSGVMALVDIPEPALPEHVDFALLIEDIQDPGNLGSMLRTAAAAGVQVAYLSKGCTDAWSPKALRGGQGAQFVLPVVEAVDAIEVVNAFAGNTLALTMQGDSLYQQSLREPVLFAVGNEGAGISAALQSAVSTCITIPMAHQGTLALESLNAAAATAVALFECQRQRLLAD
ncbi:RNA methyltransferase [Methylophilus sp.]|jgi:RNA methyltransferase, TrmH family|uniref:TrmH family RNA methyltransferase n=1 Tax=Methylophilus sp. TaxID=29541 RepID=UPI0011D92F4A|nr:RNA methyltransferase [Methylophilus sp.]TXI45122.1 MAG: RNA methyltransferase [Methylophilus sp.]